MKNQTLVDLLEQKKEMFLVTMSVGIIDNEIGKLKLKSDKTEKDLLQSEQMLKKDQDDFMKYQEQNKTAMIEAENRADKVSKEKKDRENQIKDLHLKLTSLKVEKTRNEEALSNYQDHKAFLDKLAPSEFNKKKNMYIKNLIESYKPTWVKLQLEKKEDEKMKDKEKKN